MQASTYTVTKCLETFWENIMGGGTCGYDIGINFKEKKKLSKLGVGRGRGGDWGEAQGRQHPNMKRTKRRHRFEQPVAYKKRKPEIFN